MRVMLTMADGTTHEGREPHHGAPFVEVPIPCPHCAEPLQAQGVGEQEHGHDFIASAARCGRCRREIGRIRVTFSTIFGLEEDAAVLQGRCRVY